MNGDLQKNSACQVIISREKSNEGEYSLILAAITTHKRPPEMVERALKSVIAQTYTDWNLVVVDDSPADWELRDDVMKMVEGYGENDSRIRYVAHDRNYGAQRARNTALKIACDEGFEFIAYLDDDDEWLPEKLSKQLAKFQEYDDDTAVVYCLYYYVNEEKGIMNVPEYFRILDGYVYDEMMLGDFIGSVFPLARTKSLIDVGGFDESLEANQDYDMWTRTAERYKFACVPEPLAKLHRYDGEHIWSDMRKPIKGHERLLEKYKDYFSSHKYACWKMVTSLMHMYRENGETRKSLMMWLKSVSLQPGRVGANIWNLINILYPFREWLRKKNPELFYKLRRIKRKLEGREKS